MGLLIHETSQKGHFTRWGSTYQSVSLSYKLALLIEYKLSRLSWLGTGAEVGIVVRIRLDLLLRWTR
jgi:hypothetical protein